MKNVLKREESERKKKKIPQHFFGQVCQKQEEK